MHPQVPRHVFHFLVLLVAVVTVLKPQHTELVAGLGADKGGEQGQPRRVEFRGSSRHSRQVLAWLVLFHNKSAGLRIGNRREYDRFVDFLILRLLHQPESRIGAARGYDHLHVGIFHQLFDGIGEDSSVVICPPFDDLNIARQRGDESCDGSDKILL